MHSFIEKQLLPLRDAGTVTAAFLGDSVTHGCFGSKLKPNDLPDMDYTAVYHNRFRVMISELNTYDEEFCSCMRRKPVNIINAGIGGDNAAGGLARIERDVLRYSPDLCVVNYGLNDVNGELDRYTKSLDGIFKTLRERGIPTVFLTCNMLNTRVIKELIADRYYEYAHKTAEMQNSGKLERYLDAAKTVAYSNGVLICDAHRRWLDMHRSGLDVSMMLANGINHPTRELHGLFAGCLLNTLLTGNE